VLRRRELSVLSIDNIEQKNKHEEKRGGPRPRAATLKQRKRRCKDEENEDKIQHEAWIRVRECRIEISIP
jgi:hypothetical protein